jgi:DNA invertase Pin-like site-specific DNA recombinase
MTKRAALYFRVSTCEQTTTENQRRELEEVAKRSSWEIAGIYKDAGISGAKGAGEGPGLRSPLQQGPPQTDECPKISGMVQPVLNPE